LLLFEKEGRNKDFDNLKTLQPAVRSLQYIVRLPRQRSTRLSYNQNVRENSVEDSVPNENSFWDKFQEYLLKNHNNHTAKVRLSYSKKFYHILTEANAQELMILSDEKRIHTMKALAVLAKYLGCYDRWNDIRDRYQLKWSNNEDSIQAFKNMTNPEQSYESMISWLKNTVSKLPTSYGNILLYNVLTGLRPKEACLSLSLIHKDLDDYLNKESSVLEHFKYPDVFIRRTKKAYISIATDSILQLAKQSSICGYNALRLAVKRRVLDMNMAFCRKIFATLLRTEGVEQEIIDLLQGRLPRNIFLRHYFRPTFKDEKKKVIDAIEKLYLKIIR